MEGIEGIYLESDSLSLKSSSSDFRSAAHSSTRDSRVCKSIEALSVLLVFIFEGNKSLVMALSK